MKLWGYIFRASLVKVILALLVKSGMPLPPIDSGRASSIESCTSKGEDVTPVTRFAASLNFFLP